MEVVDPGWGLGRGGGLVGVTEGEGSPLLLLNLVLVPKPNRQLALSLMFPEGRVVLLGW